MAQQETSIIAKRDIELNEGQSQNKELRNGHGIGVAFSGGGIRSAAFSSGVLRRLLQKKVPMEYMSCVSGGGYTGTAYLEWKYRNGAVDNPEWHERFFNQMRRNASAQCNWGKPFIGCIDTIGVLLLITTVVFIVPALIWIPMAFPLAYLVDYFFGNILTMSFMCRNDGLFNATTFAKANSTYFKNRNCFLVKERDNQFQIIFYAALLISIVLSFGLSRGVATQLRYLFRLAAGVLSIILAFTFLPWFFEVYFTIVPDWIKVIAFILGAILWMGIPPLRSTASWSLVIYSYSYVIKFAVYRNPVLGIVYSELLFTIITWVASGLFLFAPFFKIFQQSCIHSFYRCKLQKAFYTETSAGLTGCTGITCADFFHMISPYKSSSHEQLDDKYPEKTTLTVKDLKNIKPYYICNVLVDNWIYKNSSDPRKAFTILTISPHLIERIDDDEYKDFDEHSIGPDDIRLSDAMATSGAVVSYNMGEYTNEAALSVQMMLGVSMGKSWVSDKRLLKRTICGALIPIMIQVIMFLPLLLMPIVEFRWAINELGYVLMGIFITFVVLSFLIAILPTGKSRKSKIEHITRWCIVNIFQVRFLRELLGINNVGEVPPAILYLSDGGHVENLGLLSLLKLRMKRIIVTDGGFKSTKEEAAVDLLHSLDMARQKLRCSFTGMDGRDINEDIRDHLVELRYQKYTRHFKFRVHYFDKDHDTGISQKVSEGVILFLTPRHPSDGIAGEEQTNWAEYEEDTGITLERKRWGNGPYLSEEEVNRLTGACSQCCHCSCCKNCSEPILGQFPNHTTANQFFTCDQFSAYHREGYRSLIEGSLDEFLKVK